MEEYSVCIIYGDMEYINSDLNLFLLLSSTVPSIKVIEFFQRNICVDLFLFFDWKFDVCKSL